MMIDKMEIKIKICSICIFVLLLTSSISKGDETSSKMINAINGFGINLYKQLTKTNENLICSGFSLITVLNMLLAGARTDTAQELRQTLGYEDSSLTQKEIEDSYRTILNEQRRKHEGYDLNVANSMWIQAGSRVLPEYKKNVESNYYAKEAEVDFSSTGTDQINEWVKTETKNKIPKLFDKPLTSARMVLANALYFKGTWVNKFNKNLTVDYPFRSGKRNQNIVKMMSTVGEYNYAESPELNAQIVEIPYEGKEVSMVIVLPKTTTGLTTTEQRLTTRSLQNAINQLQSYKVQVKIPKFEASSDLPLNNALQSLGINKAFGPGADLSGINGHRDLYVSDAIQKAIIEVNEEGTVAAAASAVVIVTRVSAIPEPRLKIFTADHPFLYLIRHKPSGIVLFMGRMVEP